MNAISAIKRNRYFFPMACAAALALVLISEGSYWRSIHALDELAMIRQEQASLRTLTAGLLSAETGQRGYLLTGRKEYLEPYQRGLQITEDALQKLEAYGAVHPGSADDLRQLENLVDAKRSELALTIQLFNQGRRGPAMDLVLSDAGKNTMDSLLAKDDALMAPQRLYMEQRQSDVYESLLISRVGLAALGAISLLALFFNMRQGLVYRRQQEDLHGVLQDERDGLKHEVGARTVQLTNLAHHLLTAREDERSRLARNLHDDLGALLTSAKLDAARIKSRIATKAPDALELLAHLVTTLNNGIALGRDIIENLRPSALGNLGLAATLEILAREFAQSSGISVVCALEPVELSTSRELMVYRLVQESLTNIGKYAHAAQVWICLRPAGPLVEVSVRDDGMGFDTDARTGSAFGLVGMRFRVETEGGALSVMSKPGLGTTILASVPRSAPEATSLPTPA